MTQNIRHEIFIVSQRSKPRGPTDLRTKFCNLQSFICVRFQAVAKFQAEGCTIRLRHLECARSHASFHMHQTTRKRSVQSFNRYIATPRTVEAV